MAFIFSDRLGGVPDPPPPHPARASIAADRIAIEWFCFIVGFLFLWNIRLTESNRSLSIPVVAMEKKPGRF